MSDVIYRREWPVADAKAAVVISHGLAEHSGRYDYVAQALNAKGYAVSAYDQRGHGSSIGFPGDMGEDINHIIGDARDQVEISRREHDKVFLLAHSMGTLFSIPAVAEIEAGHLDGFIVSGIPTVPGQAILESMASGGPLPPEAVSRDPAIVQAYVDDPLVFNDAIPPELMGRIGEVFGRVEKAVPLIDIPTLIIHGSDDLLGSMEGAHKLYAELVVSDKTIKIYQGLYHEVLNEPERDEVIADVVAWLDAH